LLPKNRKICASIPIIEDQDSGTNNLEFTLCEIEKAFQKGADMIECRFDFIKNYSQIDHYLHLLTRYKDRCVYTLRAENEGGKFNNDPLQRITLLKKLIDAKPLFVDIEYELISVNNELADLVEISDARILVSWHSFVKTPSENELISLVNNMRVYSPYLKIVTTAKNIDDSLTILKLYTIIDAHINLVAFAMGEPGIISRILCSIIGDAPFTYASLSESLAPGQLSIDQMKTFDKLFKSKLI
jgi:3-dehydroquinate dehydratase-1